MKTALAIIALSLSASAANLSQEPASFTVERGDLVDQYAVLSWTLPADIAETVVYRAYGEGGPWTEVADVSDAATWTDETAPLGVPCWYKIAFAETVEEVRTVGDMCAATVSHRRCQLLERDWSDMTHVKDGVTVIWNAKGTISNSGMSSDGKTSIPAAGSIAESMSYAFDDDRYTHPNVGKPSSGRHSIGVNLGAPHFIGFVRCHPRYKATSGQYYNNFNNLIFYGSNSATSWYAATEPAITEAVAYTGSFSWYEVDATNNAPYQYVYAYNPVRAAANGGAWALTVTEIQFYGWPATATDGYAIGAVDFSLIWDGGNAIDLNWKDNGYGTSFNVERSTDGGTTWTVLASGLSATSYTDEDISLDSVERLYRVVSVSGGAVSYSATARCVPYVRGDGDGLHRSALFPFIATNVSEMTEYVSTGAVCIADATLAEERAMIDGVEGSHTNVYVTWTGKLIVPFAGSYKFTAAAKGMVSVYIDSSSVCAATPPVPG